MPEPAAWRYQKILLPMFEMPVPPRIFTNGRVLTCKLGMRLLEDEAEWIERHRQLWASRFDELDCVVEELKLKEKAHGRK